MSPILSFIIIVIISSHYNYCHIVSFLPNAKDGIEMENRLYYCFQKIFAFCLPLRAQYLHSGWLLPYLQMLDSGDK
jgi:hypothetical protein